MTSCLRVVGGKQHVKMIRVMKLVVGLGNPGKKFKGTRHNVGFTAINRLRDELQRGKGAGVRLNFHEAKKFKAKIAKLDQLLLVKPQTFMNKSGESVAKLVNFYKVKPKNLFLIHDDLDIKLGESKMQKGKGPKVHGGVLSVEEKLEKDTFWRVRIGVENRKSKEIPGERYVLLRFNNEEKDVVDSVLSEVVEALVEEIEA